MLYCRKALVSLKEDKASRHEIRGEIAGEIRLSVSPDLVNLNSLKTYATITAYSTRQTAAPLKHLANLPKQKAGDTGDFDAAGFAASEMR